MEKGASEDRAVKKMLGTFVLISLVGSITATAEIYKCEVDGNIIFSDKRCDSDAERVEVEPTTGSESYSTGSGLRPGEKAMYERLRLEDKQETRRRELQRKYDAIDDKYEKDKKDRAQHQCPEHNP